MKKNFVSLLLTLTFSSLVWASTKPICMSKGQVLTIMNEQVLQWKKQTRNQYKNRAHVEGTLANLYPDKTGHVHISLRIGDAEKDTIEVIYNEKFGRLPDLQIGSEIQACGDYITSNARTKRYPTSPDGAILHWVHKSNNGRHDHGFMIIDDIVYGY